MKVGQVNLLCYYTPCDVQRSPSEWFLTLSPQTLDVSSVWAWNRSKMEAGKKHLPDPSNDPSNDAYSCLVFMFYFLFEYVTVDFRRRTRPEEQYLETTPRDVVHPIQETRSTHNLHNQQKQKHQIFTCSTIPCLVQASLNEKSHQTKYCKYRPSRCFTVSLIEWYPLVI